MSLEAAIKANTDAVNQLIAMLERMHRPNGLSIVAPSAPPATYEEAKAITTEPPPPVPIVDDEDEPANDEPVTLDSIKSAFIGLTKARDRSAGIALLNEFGVKLVSDLPETRWAEFMARIREAA